MYLRNIQKNLTKLVYPFSKTIHGFIWKLFFLHNIQEKKKHKNLTTSNNQTKINPINSNITQDNQTWSTQPTNHQTSHLKPTQIKKISKQNLDPQRRQSCDPTTTVHHNTTYHCPLILLKPKRFQPSNITSFTPQTRTNPNQFFWRKKLIPTMESYIGQWPYNRRPPRIVPRNRRPPSF